MQEPLQDKLIVVEPFAVRNSKKSSRQVTDLRNMGPLKDLSDSKLIVYESK